MTMIDAILGNTTHLMEKSLALRMARHNYLASNIANAETPNYRAVDIDFRATMDQLARGPVPEPPRPFELEATHPTHLSFQDLTHPARPEGIVFAAGDDESVGNDNNSVNLELQLSRLQANTMMFNLSAQIMKRRIAGLSNVIETSGRV